MFIKKRARNALSALVAGAAALMLAVGGVSIANADGHGRDDIPLILPGEGGEPIQGTVTVHKHEQGPNTGAPANGLEQTPGTPTIAGVTFTAQQIESFTAGGTTYDVDLTTNQGWLNAAQLVRAADGTWTYNGEPATVTLGAAVTANTGPEGGTYQNAVFANLPVGLYLFNETDAPDNVTRSAPWVMTVPLTDPVGDSAQGIEPNERWNYDLHVYPKNSITGLDKTVAEGSATSVGDAITWSITGDIPLVANPEYDASTAVSTNNLKFFAPTAYVITDNLDSRLTPAATNPVTVTMVNGVALDAADYTVAWAPNATTAGADLTLTFTKAGRDKLGLAVSQATAPAEVKVKVVLTTVITSLTAPEAGAGTIGDGIIANQAQLFPNQNAVDSDTPVLSPEPETRWGDILIEKVDSRDATVKLQDAEFQVFTTEENALAGSDPVTINGVSTFTTDENGVVRISGLRHSDWANNALITNEDNWQHYWIVETKSPNGYELLAEPIRVAVTQAQQAVELATEIENVPTSGGFELPLTGASGTLLFTIIGLLLIGGGLALALRKKKQTA